jgi:hypothetical protein
MGQGVAHGHTATHMVFARSFTFRPSGGRLFFGLNIGHPLVHATVDEARDPARARLGRGWRYHNHLPIAVLPST